MQIQFFSIFIGVIFGFFGSLFVGIILYRDNKYQVHHFKPDISIGSLSRIQKDSDLSQKNWEEISEGRIKHV